MKLNFENFRTRTFIELPLQCYRCQGFRHNARNCQGKEKCVVCAGQHRLSECPKDKVQCAGYGEAHTASPQKHQECTRFKRAKEVERIRTEHKLT